MARVEDPQVVCIGVVTLDALALVEQYPRRDQRVIAHEIMFAGGGPAATAAVVLARQGVSVAFVGRIGADLAGEQALQQLADEGVDVSGVDRDPTVATQTSCVVVSQASQTRAISTLSVPPLKSITSTARKLIAAAEWVHADHLGFEPLAAELAGRAIRPKVSLDAGNPVAGLDPTMVDLVGPTLPSPSAWAKITAPDLAAASVLAVGTESVVATDGASGSFAWWARDPQAPASTVPGSVFVPADRSVEIRSTLGAGDVFHGGLLAALCRREGWESALTSANATAALSCRALDGRTAIPDLAELAGHLRTTATSQAQ